MKNVLLLLHDDEGQEARFQVALDVTRALSGHLTCLDVIVPAPVVSDMYAGIADNTVLVDACEREDTNLAAIRDRLRVEDVAWDVQQAVGNPAGLLRSAADLADVIVVSARKGRHDMLNARAVAAELAARSHRPVLAVPPGRNGLDLTGTVVVAWDGSDESDNALRAAIPLLMSSRDVVLLTVGLDSDFAADDAAAYLSRHGIEPHVLRLPKSGEIADTILAVAANRGATYVVMGAYGHGRLVDALTGGVTGDILDRSEIPLLLVH